MSLAEPIVVTNQSEPRIDSPSLKPLRIFVHLARDKDPEAWRRARAAGTLVGFNDETPYGYGRAEAMGCEVAISRSLPESLIGRFARLAIRAATGFDYLHARRQGAALRQADVIWTHTESQFLAVAALLRGSARRPKLLGQSVWLFDLWSKLSAVRRWFYRRLIKDVDVLTVHSDSNLAIARTLFPDKKIELVRFGIPAEKTVAPRPRDSKPLGVLSVGSDRHRDWNTLVAAISDLPDVSLTILSGSLDPGRWKHLSHVTVRRARTNEDLLAELERAAVVCVPLAPNHHASGITAIQEAVLSGIPVIATDTGGLAGYFPRDEVTYVPPADPAALREAILSVAADQEAALAQARRAQARMARGEIGAEAFIRRHVEISRELLQS